MYMKNVVHPLTAWVERFFFFCLAALAAYAVAALYRTPDYQWDFRTYYAAAQALEKGCDPYKLDDLARSSGIAIRLPFVYSPVAITLFKPLLALPLQSALVAWLSLKIVLLSLLIALWTKSFLRRNLDWFFFAFCLVGFNSTIFKDLGTGNISIMEQAVLWTSFWLLLQGRTWLFAAGVCFAALFKVFPLIFLVLILALGRGGIGKRLFVTAISLLAFILVMLACWLASPHLMESWMASLLNLQTLVNSVNGIVAPSSLTLIQDLAGKAGLNGNVANACYVLFCAGILALSALAIIRPMRRQADGDKRILYLCCLVYALIHPRFMCYSSILLIVPAFYAMTKSEQRMWPLLLLASIPSDGASTLPGIVPIWNLVQAHIAFFTALAFWLWYILQAWTCQVPPCFQEDTRTLETLRP